MSDYDLTPDDVISALDAVLRSEEFRATEKREKFLSYVVRKVLAGQADEIKGYSIGVDVYGRDKDFNPASDPIVRLEAGRLRRDLEHYYLTEGQSDQIEFRLPVGSYVPVIERRTRDVPSLPSTRASETAASPRKDIRGRQLWEHPRQRSFLYGAVAGAALASLVIFVASNLPSVRPPTAVEATLARPPVTRARLLIAPFESVGGASEATALARGLSHEIAGIVTQFPEVAVFPVPSQFRYDREPLPTRASGVPNYWLSGTVRIVDEKLRIIANLRRAGDGEQLWSERFDAKYDPRLVFDIQDRIATSVARKLAEPYGVLRETARIQLRYRHEPELHAYQCVLLAYQYRQSFTRDLHGRARTCLEQAVKVDADYARAWAMLAYLIVDEIRLFYNVKENAIARSLAAAEKAVALDSRDPLSYQALSVAQFTAGDLESGLTSARRAVEKNPHNMEALWQLGFRTWLSGEYGDGTNIARQALANSLAPPSWFHWVLAADSYRRQDYQTARYHAELMGTPNLVFAEAVRAMTYGQLGLKPDAQKSLKKLRTLAPGFDERAKDWFIAHQIRQELLEHFMDGLTKAGLRG